MSQAIDERIVSMEFDNERFEKNIGQTMQSLEKLDQQIDSSANDINNSFDKVSAGFFNLDQIIAGFNLKIGGYFAELATKAASFAKNLSFGQISKGFEKYTSETKAVQTIISNTDETLEHTYEVLGGILTYTDETSYHYDKLVDTMSQFANTGIDLERSATAVKGIANWAALSGAGIDNADYAMNALVKSISSGKMQLTEWNTISKVAHMGNKQFVDTLIETGEAMGKLEKGTLNFSNFRNEAFGNDALIDAELLLATLERYGDETTALGRRAKAAAQEAKTFQEALGAVEDAVSTGWLATYRAIFGNYEEAKRVWTGVQDAMLEVFTIGMEFRNKVLADWHKADKGGFEDLISSVEDLWVSLKVLAEPIGDAFHKIFGLDKAEEATKKLTELTTKFRNFSTLVYDYLQKPQDLETLFDAIKNGTTDELDDSFIKRYSNVINSLSADNFDVLSPLFIDEEKKREAQAILDDIRNSFKGVFSVIKTGADIIKGFVSAIWSVITNVGRLIRPILNLTGSIGNVVSKFYEAVDSSKIIQKTFKSLADVVNTVLNPVIDFLSILINGLAKVIDSFAEKTFFVDIFTTLGEAIRLVAKLISGKLTDAFDWLKGAAEKIVEKLKPLKDIFSDISSSVYNTFKSFSRTESESNVPTLFNKIADAIGKIAQWLLDNAFLPALGGFVTLIEGLLKAAQPLGGILETIGVSIGKIFDSIFSRKKDVDGKSNPLTVVFETLSSIVNFLTEKAVVPLLDGLSKVFQDLADNTKPLGKIFEDVTTSIKNFFTGLFGGEGTGGEAQNAETANNISSFLKTAGEVISDVAGWLGGILKKIRVALSGEIDKIKALNISDIFNFIKDIVGILAGIAGGRILWNIGTFTGNLANISDAIKGFVQNLTGAKKSASIIKDVGEALLMVAAACLMVASIDSAKLKEAAAVITDFMETLIAAAIGINAVSSYFTTNIKLIDIGSNNKGLNLFASNLVDLGLAVLLIAQALKSIASADISKEKIKPALDAIEEIIIVLSTASMLMSLAKGGRAKGIIALGVMVMLLAKVIQYYVSISDMVDIEKMERMTDIMSKLLISLGLVIAAISLFTGKGSETINPSLTVKFKTGILQIALVIGALAALMYVIKDIKFDVNIRNTLVGLIAFVGIIALLMAAVSSLKITFNDTTGLLSLIFALGLMTGVLIALSKVDFDKACEGLLALFAAFVTSVGLANIAMMHERALDKLSTVLIGFGIAAAAFGASVFLIAEGFRIFAETMADTVPRINSSGSDILSKVDKVVDGMIAVVANAVPKLVKLATDMIVAFVKQITDSAELIINSVVDLIAKVASAIDKNSDKLADAIGKLMLALVRVVKKFVDDYLPKIFETLKGTGSKIIGIIGGVVDAAGGILGKLFDVFKDSAPIMAGGAVAIGVGKIGTAIGSLTEKFTLVTKASEIFTKALTFLTAHPIVAVISAIAAISTAAYTYMQNVTKMSDETRKFLEMVNEHAEAINREYEANKLLSEQRDETISKSENEFKYYKGLADELFRIADANGKVKDGYTDRANFIAGELKNAYGIEIEIINGQIQGYNNLKNSIYDTIDAQRAAAVMSSWKPEYEKAIQSRTESITKVSQATRDYSKTQKEFAEKDEEYKKLLEQYEIEYTEVITEENATRLGITEDSVAAKLISVSKERAALEKQLATQKSAYDQATYNAEKYAYDMAVYEHNATAVSQKRYDDIITINYETAKNYAAMSDDVKESFDALTKHEYEASQKMIEEAERAASGVKKAFDTSTDYYSKGYRTTQDYIEGLVAGLDDPTANDKLSVRAKAVAQKVIDLNRHRFDEHSPSKVAYEIGKFFVIGLANGIGDTEYMAANASKDMASNTISSMQSAIDLISDLKPDEFSEPVISPVLDLSEIQNGAKSIGGLFGNGYSIPFGLSAALASANYSGSPQQIITMNIYGAEGQNVEELADAVSRRLNSQFKQRSNVWK